MPSNSRKRVNPRGIARENTTKERPTWKSAFAPNPNQEEKLLRMRSVLELVPMSRPGLYDLIRRGLFPRPISLGGGNAVAWSAREVQEFIQARIAERNGPAKDAPAAEETGGR